MPRVVDIAFRRAGRRYLFNARDLELAPGDYVITRTSRGLELGLVRTEPREVPGSELSSDLRAVERRATEADFRRDERNVEREDEALAVAAEKVAEHGLSMKLIEAECTLDGSRIVIHFSAEGRVDFRALVRDLARALHTRIELHQVGVRDEAKMRGGLGHCGRPLCCATFLTEFDPVGIRMAKEQDLSLNPQKISGICGRLMCCLNYEFKRYHEAKQCLPKVGSRVETIHGPGKLTQVNVLRDRVVVTLEEGGQIELPTSAVASHKPGCPDTGGSASPGRTAGEGPREVDREAPEEAQKEP
jgi:cell fate regulator YaaT (PSP1 superfamily)